MKSVVEFKKKNETSTKIHVFWLCHFFPFCYISYSIKKVLLRDRKVYRTRESLPARKEGRSCPGMPPVVSRGTHLPHPLATGLTGVHQRNDQRVPSGKNQRPGYPQERTRDQRPRVPPPPHGHL